MKLAIMQPYVFPYIGYFQLIQAVDKFVFYDDVNFIKKGWIHRNNILINGKANLFTIPCKKISQNKLINEIQISFDTKEKARFLKRIEYSYRKASNFNSFYPLLKGFINSDKSENISNFAINSIKFISEYLDIKKDFIVSSENHSESKGMEKQERLIYISNKEKANIYVNALGGKTLYNKEAFYKKSLELKFLKPSEINYKQNKSSFVPWLSIIDVIMFNNKKETNKLLQNYSLL